jgi:hypothetical protein
MNDFLVGLAWTIGIIGFLEIFQSFDKKLIAVITLTGIPFIYIGFSFNDIQSLLVSILAAGFFIALAYYGYKRNFYLVIAGLVLHAVWDLLFPHFSTMAPEGYDIFCITIDVLLALYFLFRVKVTGI